MGRPRRPVFNVRGRRFAVYDYLVPSDLLRDVGVIDFTPFPLTGPEDPPMNGNNIFYFETAVYPRTDTGFPIHEGQLLPVGNRIFQVLEIGKAVEQGIYRVRLVELILILEQAAPPQETEG